MVDYLLVHRIVGYSLVHQINGYLLVYLIHGYTLVLYEMEAEIQLLLKRVSRFQRLFPNPSWLV